MSDHQQTVSSQMSGSGDCEEIVETVFINSDEDAIMNDVADQLARAEASINEPNPQSDLILYSQTDPQLEPSSTRTLRKNLPKTVSKTPPVTPKLKKKGRPLKKSKDITKYPTPAQIKKMESSIRSRPPIIIDPPTQIPKSPVLPSKSIKDLPRIPKISKSKSPKSKSGNPLLSKKPVLKPVELVSTSRYQPSSPVLSSEEEEPQVIVKTPVKTRPTLTKGNKTKTVSKKRVTFSNSGGGDVDNFDKLLIDAENFLETMAPEVRVVMTELLESRPTVTETVDDTIEEYYEDDPIIDEPIVSAEQENIDNVEIAPETATTGITPQIQLIDLNRPLDLNMLNQNISMLNTFIAQGFGRVVIDNNPNTNSNISNSNLNNTSSNPQKSMNTSLKNRSNTINSKSVSNKSKNNQNSSNRENLLLNLQNAIKKALNKTKEKENLENEVIQENDTNLENSQKQNNDILQNSSNFKSSNLQNKYSHLDLLLMKSDTKRDYKLEKNSRIDLWLDHFNSELNAKRLKSVIDDLEFEKENFDEKEIEFRRNLVREIIISHIDIKFHSQVLNYKDPIEMLKHLKFIKKCEKNLDSSHLRKKINSLKYVPSKQKAIDFIEHFENLLRTYENLTDSDPLSTQEKRDAFYNAIIKTIPDLFNTNFNYKTIHGEVMPLKSLKAYILQLESQHNTSVIEPVALYANRATHQGYSTRQTYRQISNRCFECADNGHLARNCPNPGLVKCYKCQTFYPKNLNHKSANCTVLRPEYKSLSNQSNLRDKSSRLRSGKNFRNVNRRGLTNDPLVRMGFRPRYYPGANTSRNIRPYNQPRPTVAQQQNVGLPDLRDITAGLTLTEISIPKHIDHKEKAQLSCKFEITRGNLYSVKWYKDEFEFFRYMPDSAPPIQTFPVDGVHLDISQSNKTTVTLYNLSLNSSGNYRCEVSKEGPNFETVVRNGDMRVMVYPEYNPIITGIQDKYSIGTSLSGTCTSPRSNPVAELTWYINNKKANKWEVEERPVTSSGDLYSKSLKIEFIVRREHFDNNVLDLRCSARIADIPPWERSMKIHLDNPLPEGIQAQNHINRGRTLTEQVELILTLLLLNRLYSVFS